MMSVKFMKMTVVLSAFLSLSAFVMPFANAQSDISVYLSRPKDGLSPYSDATTETFSSRNPGTYTSTFVSSIGTYSTTGNGKYAIVRSDQFGAGMGNYLAVGAQSGSAQPLVLTFNTPQSYFGFTWNAGDNLNELTFYNGDQIVGYYTTASVMSLLSASTVTALDGNTYNSRDYFGQPNTGANNSEPYAFLNFIANTGSFSKVVFSNKNSSGSGFESDNHTIRQAAPDPDRSFVFVGRTTTLPVPEPQTLALLLPGMLLAGIVRTRRSR